jgi:hypothetical protein
MPAKKRSASPHPEERPAKIQNTKDSSPTRSTRPVESCDPSPDLEVARQAAQQTRAVADAWLGPRCWIRLVQVLDTLLSP